MYCNIYIIILSILQQEAPQTVVLKMVENNKHHQMQKNSQGLFRKKCNTILRQVKIGNR